MQWQVIDTGLLDAQEIMEKDRKLLEDLTDRPILHFYQWKGKSATYGHFINPSQFFCMEHVNKAGLHLAKRPTGGGIIFHLWDFAFSVLIPSSCSLYSPNTMQNYATINTRVLSAVEELLQLPGCELTEQEEWLQSSQCAHFCMAKPTRYDVMLHGKKVAGAAQRKTKKGFLHQGSISLVLPDEAFLRFVLRPDCDVLSSMKQYTLPVLGDQALIEDILKSRNHIQTTLQKYFI